MVTSDNDHTKGTGTDLDWKMEWIMSCYEMIEKGKNVLRAAPATIAESRCNFIANIL